MSERVVSKRKLDYRARLESYLEQYRSIAIMTVDNVGSNQLQKIRIVLRGKAAVLLGKNTIMRKVIREHPNTQLHKLLPLLKGNIGFIFTNADLSEIKKLVTANKVPAAAKVGSVAPTSFTLPEGPTGLDPGQTSFFQALNIATKIVKGSIEIINPVPIIKEGERVSASASALLSKLNIKPFFYGARLPLVYESGTVYDAKVLDFTQEDLVSKFRSGVSKLTAVALQIGYPTASTVPHSIGRAFKNAVALALSTDITFKQAEKFKEMAKNPGAFAAAAPAAAAGAPAAAAKKKEEPKKEEPEEEENAFGGLFD